MPNKTFVFDQIKKLMGWCPNAKALETQHSFHTEYFGAGSQSGGKDAENPLVLPAGWWNIRHNRALIISSGLTLFSILGIGFLGVDPGDEYFMSGLIAGAIFNLLICIWNWHFLNKVKNSSKSVRTKNKLITIAGILSLITLLIQSSMLDWRVVLAFISGFCLTAFLYYLTDLYWEKKNGKIVLLGGYYEPEIYILDS
ncbi:MAG: DUF1673 domain-containing protein [Euryarchaeota archaeon]|nr:DUF1673 domain-containing protein [Euryarchaeota archaeon]